MVKNKFNSEIAAEITEIDGIEELEIAGDCTAATLETEKGLSKHKKFVLIDVSDIKKPYLIIQNLDGAEKQECCELLEKMLFGETYAHLEENSIRVGKPEYTDFEH